MAGCLFARLGVVATLKTCTSRWLQTGVRAITSSEKQHPRLPTPFSSYRCARNRIYCRREGVFTATSANRGLSTCQLLQRRQKWHQKTSTHSQPTGLFDNTRLSKPDGFETSAREAISKSMLLVDEINSKADSPTIEIIDKMDELSDTLCRVADLAECIRQVHPEQEVAERAQEACLEISNYVEQLNTDTGLHRALRVLMDSKEFGKLDEVTRRTAEVFMHDFEISGIHLESSLREEVVRLNNQILELVYRFSKNATLPVHVPASECPPYLRDFFSGDSQVVQIDHVPMNSPNSRLRMLSYLVYYGVNPSQTEVLEKLLAYRHKLASLVGYPSYAHRVLKTSMAANPDTVMSFLQQLKAKIQPLVGEEVEEMLSLKQEISSRSSDSDQLEHDVLRPWDYLFLSNEAQKRCLPDDLKTIRNWFSLDDCLHGLDHLFYSLFSVNLKQVPTKPGEIWDPRVRKIAFVHEREGLLGYTYGDFFTRPGKLVSDCHFMIQGGRELAPSISSAVNGSVYQLPIIALCCSFDPPTSSHSPCLLSQHSVENLFHEMGHALHSMVGRAKYQNITGTRCSTDFAEVPSILMEYFLNDTRVLSSFARHYTTNEPLPANLMDAFQVSQHFFPAYEMQTQLFFAMMDLHFHTVYPSQDKVSIMDSYAHIHREYSPSEHVDGTAWFLRFNHICSYGAKYYSYLWSRAVASLIWNSCFIQDPFSETSGQKLHSMLRHGGGIDPNTLVGEMLGFRPTVEDLVDSLCTDIAAQKSKIAKLIQ